MNSDNIIIRQIILSKNLIEKYPHLNIHFLDFLFYIIIINYLLVSFTGI